MKRNRRKQQRPTNRPPVQASQTASRVPPPQNLTPELCDRLRRDLRNACQQVAETHGLVIEGGELSDIDLRHSFAFSLRVGIPMKDGQIYSPDKAIFEALAPQFGLEPSDYRRTFTYRHEIYRIEGINPNRPKYPISVVRIADGRGFKFPANQVVLYL